MSKKHNAFAYLPGEGVVLYNLRKKRYDQMNDLWEQRDHCDHTNDLQYIQVRGGNAHIA